LVKQLRQFNHHALIKRHEKTTFKIIAIVAGLFLVCYGIFLLCSVLSVANHFTKDCDGKEYKIPILVLSSAINPLPLAYALLKRDIKKEFTNVTYTYVVRFKLNK